MIKSLDCACVIHGDKYDWIYVERLYQMVKNNLSCDVNFHVFTESSRPVPEHMIKHELVDWPGIAGPRKSWWYKMQVFDPSRISGQVLYLDLDVVIVDNLDWILDLDVGYFWIIRDWKYLWKPTWMGPNSSVMLWNTDKFRFIWNGFSNLDINKVVQLYRGDQDYLDTVLTTHNRKFFQEEFIKSWRWQIKDGGFNFKTRAHNLPKTGSTISPGTKIMVFHGAPKPHEIQDPVIALYWTR